MKNPSSILSILTAVCLLFGSTAVLTAETTVLNHVGPNQGFPRVFRSYESMDAVYSRTGTIRSVAAVRNIEIGSSKDQVVASIGNPVFAYRDGSWNFNVALPLPQRNTLICQYRVYFDENELVQGTVWRRPQCADIVLGQ